VETKDYGRYTLLKKLATGGMAEVFLARQKGLEGFEKLLVIKRILPHLADDAEFVSMFLNEARIAARFNHPNIVQIYDLGKEEDTYFIAMEFIHGEDLGRIMRRAWKQRAWIPVPIALRIVASVCEGLYYAHTKTDEHGNPLKVVHRDISPQNIIVSFDGNVKLVDFGIARAADQSSTTRAGSIKGKYAYMSPEQASGKVVDQRSDIFAVGLVLFELLTGMRPLKRDNDLMTLKAAVDCQFPLPSQVAHVPPEADALVMKALQRVADDRYQDARAFQMAIESYLVDHKLNASNIHVSEMMRELFGDRLAEEARLGEPVVLKSEVTGVPVPPSYPGTGSQLLPRLPTRDGITALPLPQPSEQGKSERPPPLPRIASAEWNNLAAASQAEAAPAPASQRHPSESESWEAPPGVARTPIPRRRSTAGLKAVAGPSAAPRLVDPGFSSQPAPEPEPAPAAEPVRRRPTGEMPRRKSSAGVPISHRTSTGEHRRRSVLYADEEEMAREHERKAEAAEAVEAAEREEEERLERERKAKRRVERPRRSRTSILPGLLVGLIVLGTAAIATVPEARQAAFKLVAELQARHPGIGGGLDTQDPTKVALLSMESNVPVDVFLGERKLGTTPLRGVKIPVGRSQLTLLNPNLGIERTVTINAEQGDEVSHREKFSLGRVHFTAEKECDVIVNGRKVARIPGPPLDFFEGSYDAECRNDPLKLVGRAKVRIPADPSRTVEVGFKLQPQ
jgi:serine/threonine protein kinase